MSASKDRAAAMKRRCPGAGRRPRQLASRAPAGEYRECIELMQSGKIDLDPLISALAPLNEGAGWFHRLYDREPGLMKVILQP